MISGYPGQLSSCSRRQAHCRRRTIYKKRLALMIGPPGQDTLYEPSGVNTSDEFPPHQRLCFAARVSCFPRFSPHPRTLDKRLPDALLLTSRYGEPI